MSHVEIRSMVLEALRPRLEQLGLKESEVRDDLDLVGSGLLNSMEFVELVAGIETQAGVEIDYEKALDDDSFTTLKGIIAQIEQS